MKRGAKYIFVLFFLALAAGVLLAPSLTLAAIKVNYSPSQQLPGLDLTQSAGQAGQTSSLFPQFIRWMLPFVLSLAAVLAVIMIVVAGVRMVIQSDNPAAREDAKARIWAAIGGLVLAFAAFLILRTINPDLVGLKFDLGSPVQFRETETAAQRDARDVFKATPYAHGETNAEPNAYCVFSTTQKDLTCPEGSYSVNPSLCGENIRFDIPRRGGCTPSGGINIQSAVCCMLGSPSQSLNESDVGGIVQPLPVLRETQIQTPSR